MLRLIRQPPQAPQLLRHQDLLYRSEEEGEDWLTSNKSGCAVDCAEGCVDTGGVRTACCCWIAAVVAAVVVPFHCSVCSFGSLELVVLMMKRSGPC